MPQIASGSNATFAVASNQTLTIQAAEAWVSYENPIGTIVAQFRGTRAFPITSAGSAKLTVVSGPAVYYELDPTSATQISPYILAQSGVPVILPSSGTSNASGQITLTTALPYQPSGVVGLYLPAGVVTAGSQGSGAGVYQVQFSSTTVCQIAGTGIVTANAAYTQTTGAQLTLASAAVPAGSLGANGRLRLDTWWTHIGNTNTKIERAVFGGTFLADRQANSATQITFRELLSVRNRGAQNVNLLESSWGGGLGADTGLFKAAAVDTSVQQPLTFAGQLAVATDYIILEGYTVEVLPAN